jgi:hypothetical protein
MSITLSSGQLEQLASAQKAIAGLLEAVTKDEKAEVRGCSECSGTCTDSCTGCQTCKDTSKAG